jgi:hypothetical protein
VVERMPEEHGVGSSILPSSTTNKQITSESCLSRKADTHRPPIEAASFDLQFPYQRPREESNPHIRLRSPEFYPLNYEGKLLQVKQAKRNITQSISIESMS